MFGRLKTGASIFMSFEQCIVGLLFCYLLMKWIYTRTCYVLLFRNCYMLLLLEHLTFNCFYCFYLAFASGRATQQGLKGHCDVSVCIAECSCCWCKCGLVVSDQSLSSWLPYDQFVFQYQEPFVFHIRRLSTFVKSDIITKIMSKHFEKTKSVTINMLMDQQSLVF